MTFSILFFIEDFSEFRVLVVRFEIYADNLLNLIPRLAFFDYFFEDNCPRYLAFGSVFIFSNKTCKGKS